MMSVSYSDCFTDLLCEEESSGFLSGDLSECSSELQSPAFIEESIPELIEDEKDFVPGFDYLARYSSQSLDASAREESVAWILKVHARYGFQPLTAYLSVNYLDRFLYARSLPQTDGWPMQLLSVACLSLAAKMEELLVPSLMNLQVEGVKYTFEPRTIRRMEMLVLSVLDWRLRSITPFSFIHLFACKIDPSGTYVGYLISRSDDIILSNIQESRLLEYRPSCIAVAAVVCSASEIPSLSPIKPENAEAWCDGLSKEKIMGCYKLMQKLDSNHRKRKAPRVLPRFRVTTMARARSSDLFSSASLSSPSSSSSPSPYKRRKISNYLWVGDDRESSE